MEWADDDDVPVLYANQLLISHSGPEFFLVFGLLVPPLSQEHLPDVLAIRPQVRVIISRDVMPTIVQALNEHLRRVREAPPTT